MFRLPHPRETQSWAGLAKEHGLVILIPRDDQQDGRGMMYLMPAAIMHASYMLGEKASEVPQKINRVTIMENHFLSNLA